MEKENNMQKGKIMQNVNWYGKKNVLGVNENEKFLLSLRAGDFIRLCISMLIYLVMLNEAIVTHGDILRKKGVLCECLVIVVKDEKVGRQSPPQGGVHVDTWVLLLHHDSHSRHPWSRLYRSHCKAALYCTCETAVFCTEAPIVNIQGTGKAFSNTYSAYSLLYKSPKPWSCCNLSYRSPSHGYQLLKSSLMYFFSSYCTDGFALRYIQNCSGIFVHHFRLIGQNPCPVFRACRRGAHHDAHVLYCAVLYCMYSLRCIRSRCPSSRADSCTWSRPRRPDTARRADILGLFRRTFTKSWFCQTFNFPLVFPYRQGKYGEISDIIHRI